MSSAIFHSFHFRCLVGRYNLTQHEQAMTGHLPSIVSAIVTAAREVAADLEYASTEENLTPERASPLKALSENFYAIAFQAEENDPEAVRFVCDMLGLKDLLKDYDAQCGPEQITEV